MRVGTSKAYKMPLILKGDHPHACGDKLPCGVSLVKLSGSSPCVWGQANTDTTKRERMRIIPMRVGTRELLRQWVQPRRDHPHACGDKKTIRPKEPKPRGSSPCVWGQAYFVMGNLCCSRIIPMRVGTR